MQKVADLLSSMSTALSKATQQAASSMEEATHTAKNDLAGIYNQIGPAKEGAWEAETRVLNAFQVFVKETKAVFDEHKFPPPPQPVTNTIVSQPVFNTPVVFVDHDPINNTRTITTQQRTITSQADDGTFTGTMAPAAVVTSGNRQVETMDSNGNPIAHSQLNPPPSDAPLGSEGIITTDASEVADSKTIDTPNPESAATETETTGTDSASTQEPQPNINGVEKTAETGPGNPPPAPPENTDLTKEPFTPESTTIQGHTGNEA